MNDLDLVTPPPGMPEVRLTLLAAPSTVVLARELVRYALTNWGFDRDVINDSTLVMSEMVTNAVTAARGRRLRLRRALCGGTPLLECWDPSPGLPAQRTPSLMAENGRGLAIIHAYVKETGTRPSATGEGKTVWGKCPPERPGPNTSRRSCIWGRPSPRFRGWSAASRTAGAHGLGFGRGWSGGTHFPGGMWAVGWGKPERAGGQCRKISTIPPPPNTRSTMSGSAGDVVQARDIEGGVHFHYGRGTPHSAPWQLPRGVRVFVNRRADLRRLDALVTGPQADAADGLVAYVIAGTAGVGKTSLVLH
ncbi:ATP-binding protein [Spirillospora sp. NPDC047418]